MTMLEIGPSTVRRLPPAGGPAPNGDLVAQAFAGIDDTTVLIEERPVTVDSLWRHLISDSIGNDCAPVTLVHPSWWPQRWVARILDAADSVIPDVVAQPRSSLIGSVSDATTVVELSDEVVAVCREATPLRGHPRSADAATIASAAGADRPERVLIDVPQGVHDGESYADAIRRALLHNGITADIVRLEDALAWSSAGSSTAAPVRRSWLGPQILAAAVVGIVVCGVGVATTRPAGGSVANSGTVSLVESRVSLRIPVGWTVTRITDGPGSRRVEIDSSADDSAALHVTQSYTPEETLDITAQVLRGALAREAPGTFVEFHPNDERAGRSAVTYREVRAGRDIRWSVIVDGSTRIGIGCQSVPGGQVVIDPACDEAIRSAREIVGTPQR